MQINVEKRGALIVGVLVVAILAFGIISAVIDPTLPWHPLQQIATSASSTVSVDENANGVIDDSDALGGKGPSQYCGSDGLNCPSSVTGGKTFDSGWFSPSAAGNYIVSGNMEVAYRGELDDTTPTYRVQSFQVRYINASNITSVRLIIDQPTIGGGTANVRSMPCEVGSDLVATGGLRDRPYIFCEEPRSFIGVLNKYVWNLGASAQIKARIIITTLD